jgi:alpha-beta hydrolase superfamily lysophospholipase
MSEHRPAARQTFIDSADGGKILVHWLPGKPDGPLFWYVHGFQSDGTGNKSTALMEMASGLGAAFVSADFRGHGRSTPTHPDGALLGLCHETLLDDLRTVRKFTAGWHQGPRVLVGSSMGGYASSWFAAEHPEAVQGLVLAAPAFRFGFTMLGRMPGLTAEAWRNSGSVEYQGMGGPVRLGWKLYEQAEGRNEVTLAHRLNPAMPVRIFHAVDDDVIPYADSVSFVAAAGPDVSLALSRSGGHRLQESAFAIAMAAGELARGS